MLANAVKETTATTGTGTLTLSSAAGFARFSTFTVGSVVDYAIKTAGGDWEWGLGTVGASNTLARTAVIATLVSGTYNATSASALSLTGTSEVVCTAHAQSIAPVMPSVHTSAGARYIVPDGLQMATNTKAISANTPKGACLRWSSSALITHLVCEITTANGTGSDRIQLGIYACTPSGTIGDLIARTGDMATNSTGVKSSAINGGSIRLAPGWYWWVMASSAAPTVRAYNAGSLGCAVLGTPMGHLSGSLGTRNGDATFSALSGGWTALPTTLTFSSFVSIAADFPPTVGAIVS